MYLFLGNKTVISDEEIIGIFDLDSASISKNTRNFLKRAEDNNEVESVILDLPKSFIVCKSDNKEKQQKIVLSTGMTATLSKRISEKSNFGGYISE
ncbi:MAG: DUF370 domain-containing protein [Clostridia bacterium]|nr:DUF370 domain-containing protein [Clostridia bacterium]